MKFYTKKGLQRAIENEATRLATERAKEWIATFLEEAKKRTGTRWRVRELDRVLLLVARASGRELAEAYHAAVNVAVNKRIEEARLDVASFRDLKAQFEKLQRGWEGQQHEIAQLKQEKRQLCDLMLRVLQGEKVTLAEFGTISGMIAPRE